MSFLPAPIPMCLLYPIKRGHRSPHTPSHRTEVQPKASENESGVPHSVAAKTTPPTVGTDRVQFSRFTGLVDKVLRLARMREGMPNRYQNANVASIKDAAKR